MFAQPYLGILEKDDSLTSVEKQSFHSGFEVKLLPIGFELWRFVSKQKHNRFGAYWVDVQTMQSIMQTLHINNVFTESYKKENVQNSLAILSPWSNLSWRVKIRTRKQVIAFVGQTGTQKLFAHDDNQLSFGGEKKIEKVIETRIGRQMQYVIPRFRNLPDLNNWANVEVFVHI